MSEEKKEEKAISRRKYLGAVGGLAAAAAVGWGLAGYLASKPPAPAAVKTITETKTVAATPMVTTPTTPIPRKAYKGTTIRFITSETVPEHAFEKILPEFEEETGIKVDYEVYDEVTVREKTLLDFHAHTGKYDVPYLQWWFTPEYAKAGYIENLDPWIQTKADPEWLNPADYIPAVLEGMKWNGSVYGLPFWIISCLAYVNKDIAMKYYGKIPTTLEEIIECAKKCHHPEKGIYGYTGRGNPAFDMYGSVAGFAWGMGAKLFEENWKPRFTEPDVIKAIGQYVELLKDYGPPGQATITWFEAEQIFLRGQVAVYMDTSDYGPDLENPDVSKVVGKVAYIPCPIGPTGKRAQWFYAEGLAINKDSKNKEAAWLFIQWRCSKEAFIREMKSEVHRMDFPSMSLLRSPEYEEIARKIGLYDYVMGLRKAIEYAEPGFWPFIPEFSKVCETLCIEVSSAIAGEKSVEEALKEAQTECEKILKEAGYF